jgi:hypothetical protein
LGYYGTCGYNAVAFYNAIVHNNTSHTYQNIVMYGATMDYGVMPNRYVVAYIGWGGLVSGMYNGTVLHIDFIAHFYVIDIASNYGIKPNTALGTCYYIAYNGSIFGYITIVWQLW